MEMEITATPSFEEEIRATGGVQPKYMYVIFDTIIHIGIVSCTCLQGRAVKFYQPENKMSCSGVG